MEWWLLASEELEADEDARLAKQQAYFATFYGGIDNMHVLNDIREICFSSGKASLIEFYCELRRSAGRTRVTELAMIEAEAEAIVKADPNVSKG